MGRAGLRMAHEGENRHTKLLHVYRFKYSFDLKPGNYALMETFRLKDSGMHILKQS